MKSVALLNLGEEAYLTQKTIDFNEANVYTTC